MVDSTWHIGLPVGGSLAWVSILNFATIWLAFCIRFAVKKAASFRPLLCIFLAWLVGSACVLGELAGLALWLGWLAWLVDLACCLGLLTLLLLFRIVVLLRAHYDLSP